MDAPVEVVTSQRYMDFSAALQSKLTASRTPSNVTVEVTRRCPLECVHCYNNLPMGDAVARGGELTFAEHCRLLDELAETKPEWSMLVEMKFFLGLTDEETAEAMGVKLRTMQRSWSDARRWLYTRVETGNAQSTG